MAGSLKNRYQDVLGQAHTFLKSGNRHVANLGSKERKEHAEKVGAQCPICGARITARASNEDHILPRNLGGTNDKHNRVLMCFGCNTFRDQVQRIAFGAQGPNAAREIYKVDPERIDSFILWLQVTVDEGIVAGAAYEETQSTNSIFAEMGGSNQPNIPIENRLGRYSEWEPKIGSHSEMLETKSTEHPKSMIDSDSSDGGEVEMAEIISSTPFEYEREIRQGIIQILRDNRGTGEPMIVGAFGIEFNRMTRENNFPPRKAINQSLGLRSSATISELLDRLFGDEISYIERSPDSFYIVRRQNWKDSFRTWWRRVTELLGRIWRPNQRHVNEPVDGDQLEIPTTEPEEVDSEPVLNDIIGTEGDPIEKFLRSLSGQTVEISYLGRLLSDAFPKELGTPRQWLKEHGHGLSKPFGRILSESYSHLIDEEIQHGSTILYVIGDAESIEEISDESGNMPIPHFNSARGFLMPKNPDDVASILIAFEACRGEEFVYGEVIDHLRPNLEQPVDRIVGVIVRLRELLGITIDDDIDWDSIPTPEELLIKLKDQFNENWIPIGNYAGKIPADSVTAYFSQAFEHLGSKSRVSVKPPSSALDWLKTNTLEIMNSADGEWVNQAWFTNALNSRAEKSPYGSRQKLFVSLDFKAKESVRTVLENIMGELIQFEQVEPTYWRARLA